MTLSAWQERAKDGDAEAIAVLLNQSLKSQRLEVRAERDSYCLKVWVSGAILPPQDRLVAYLRQVIERLQLDFIGILHIEAESTTDPSQGWTTEMAMLAGLVQGVYGVLDSQDRGMTVGEHGLGNPLAMASELADDSTAEHRSHHGPQSGDTSGVPAQGENWLENGQMAGEPLPPKVARAYQELGLPADASLAEIERAYFKTKAALLRQGKRAEIEPLKWAFGTLKDYLERPPQVKPTSAPPSFLSGNGLASGAESTLSAMGTEAQNSTSAYYADPSWPTGHGQPSPDPAQVIQTLLQGRGLPAHVAQRADQLHIRWPAVRVINPKQAAAQIYELLAQQDLAAMGLGNATTLVVAALDSQNRVVWRQTLAMPQRPTAEEDTDLMSFNNRYSNGIVFPALLVIGMILNVMPIFNLLLQGIKIWIHEFGHAVIAWLAGRQALPLPLGWTNVNPERSFFVYVGVLILLGLLFWAGQKEGKRWPMVLAAGLAVVQVVMTWIMSPITFDMLLAFGGIGGELYLSTLLMVSFFFPMPTYWRWDFYRYPVVLGAAFTFWGQFWLWKRIRWGQASIPFGMMWGDAEHGDMNILINRHSWEPGDLISTYNTVANLCLLALFGVYAFALYRQHRHWIWIMRQRWLGG